MATICLTGAFGYSGRYIARALLDRGDRLRTLTASPSRAHAFSDRIAVHPLAFDDPACLVHALEGADVLVNTYWVRFARAGFSLSAAVANSQVLFDAARRAGVGRVVHVSITNASTESPFEYFRGKGRLEEALAATGLPCSILRPAVFFGGPDVLLNNIAWMLRHLPVFGIVGDGAYRLQPIHVEDFAGLVVREVDAQGRRVVEAIGPETWAYGDLVAEIGRAIGRLPRRITIRPGLARVALRLLGWWLDDVVLAPEELDALRAGLLEVQAPPAGSTSLARWLQVHGRSLGLRYASEVARRRDRLRAYEDVGRPAVPA